MPEPSVAVVILNWNGKSFLQRFLPFVTEHSPGAAIIVADNQSTDDSIDFLKTAYPHVRIIQNNANYGFARGYNEALKHVNADIYVLLNSDVEVTADWLTPVISLMQQDNRIAACQPKLLDYNNRKLFEYAGAAGGYIDKYCYPFCRGRLFNSLEADDNQYNDAREVFWATGACMFVKSKAFWEAGGFDNDYFAHMEEIDLCWRMKNLGYKVYVEPRSVVYHVGGGTLNKISPRKTYLNFRNNLITFTKNHSAGFLFVKIFYRMILDGIAAFKFLFEGSGQHFLAVIRAHFSYYAMFFSTLRKRREFRKKQGFTDTVSGVYDGNIVYDYYMKGLRKFSELRIKNS
ncbi:MAG: glycosyltransferase family 2 protein [Bacteroidetes bacterium]|nr:glycosyltransferase family 2 protein [Bacteroidota bacterium]